MTVNERIEEQAEKYFGLYLNFKKDPKWSDSAAALAEADLLLDAYIAQRALERLRQQIERGACSCARDDAGNRIGCSFVCPAHGDRA